MRGIAFSVARGPIVASVDADRAASEPTGAGSSLTTIGAGEAGIRAGWGADERTRMYGRIT